MHTRINLGCLDLLICVGRFATGPEGRRDETHNQNTKKGREGGRQGGQDVPFVRPSNLPKLKLNPLRPKEGGMEGEKEGGRTHKRKTKGGKEGGREGGRKGGREARQGRTVREADQSAQTSTRTLLVSTWPKSPTCRGWEGGRKGPEAID